MLTRRNKSGKSLTKRDKYEKEILEVIRKNKICRISHIFAFYAGIQSAQFYNLGLEKSEVIEKALFKNRTGATYYLLNKWIQSDNPTLQIAAMRLVCSKEEHQLLNQQYVSHEHSGDIKHNHYHNIQDIPIKELSENTQNMLFELNMKQLESGRSDN